jgi:hypothetical protein
MTQTKLTTRDRIEAAAAANGWTSHITGYLSRTYRKGTRYVRVSYGVRGQVIEAAHQTGSYGGRWIDGQGKAERILALLAQDRWTAK